MKESQQYQHGVMVQETPLGLGVFAAAEFEASEMVGEMTGDVLDDPEYGSDYCVDLGEDSRLEPAAPFRFLNHSCEPNCELVLWKSRRKNGRRYARAWVQTCRPIRKGEELTIDYGWPADAAIPCRCHSRRCRGWIVHPDELDTLLATACGD